MREKLKKRKKVKKQNESLILKKKEQVSINILTL